MWSVLYNLTEADTSSRRRDGIRASVLRSDVPFAGRRFPGHVPIYPLASEVGARGSSWWCSRAKDCFEGGGHIS